MMPRVPSESFSLNNEKRTKGKKEKLLLKLFSIYITLEQLTRVRELSPASASDVIAFRVNLQ